MRSYDITYLSVEVLSMHCSQSNTKNEILKPNVIALCTGR